jgi:hypothetical protein
MEFQSAIEHYKAQGAPIQNGMTDEEILQVIEDFEDHPPEPEPGPATAEERIAAALEFQNLAEFGRVSLNVVALNKQRGTWDNEMIELALEKGEITKAQYNQILSI